MRFNTNLLVICEMTRYHTTRDNVSF